MVLQLEEILGLQERAPLEVRREAREHRAEAAGEEVGLLSTRDEAVMSCSMRGAGGRSEAAQVSRVEARSARVVWGDMVQKERHQAARTARKRRSVKPAVLAMVLEKLEDLQEPWLTEEASEQTVLILQAEGTLGVAPASGAGLRQESHPQP